MGFVHKAQRSKIYGEEKKKQLKKIASENSKTRIKLLKAKINGIRISYNDKFVDRLKNKDIREKTRKIKEQIKKKIISRTNLKG